MRLVGQNSELTIEVTVAYFKECEEELIYNRTNKQAGQSMEYLVDCWLKCNK